MKRTKISLLLIFVLLFSILLTSCSSDRKVEKTLDTLFNDDYEISDKTFNEAKEVKELEGYRMRNNYYHPTQSMSVLQKHNNGYYSYKIYSMITQSVILELNDKNVEYEIYSYGHSNYFTVRYLSKINDKTELEYVAYDLTGAVIARSDTKFKDPQVFGDHVIFNDSIYKPNAEKGTLEPVSEIDSFSIPSGKIVYYNEDFVYFADSYDCEYISVFNTDLEQVYYFEPPSYVKYWSFEYLADGKVFFHGHIPVTSDADKYDYYLVDSSTNSVNKYNKYQLLIDPSKGTEREIDIDYIPAKIDAPYDLNKNYDDMPLYNNDFENIIYAYPIVDKRIDTSDSAIEMMFMDNDARITKSVKILDGQAPELPQRLSDDRFLVKMLDDTYTLIDRNGKVIASQIKSASGVGEYIISNSAIYDSNMNLVYDTRDVPEGTMSKIVGTSKNTIFVMEITEESDTFFAFEDGEKKELGKASNENLLAKDALTVMEFGYFFDEKTKTILYNLEGEIIEEFPRGYVEHCAYTDDSHLVSIGLNFYLITK